MSPSLPVSNLVVGGAIAGVPGGFVVHQHLDVAVAGRATDGEGVIERGAERLLDHDRDATLGCRFDDAPVVGDAGVDQQGARMPLRDHGVELGVEEMVIERITAFRI